MRGDDLIHQSGEVRAEPAAGEALGKPGPGAKGLGALRGVGRIPPSPGSQEGALLRSLAGLGCGEAMGRPPPLNTTTYHCSSHLTCIN